MGMLADCGIWRALAAAGLLAATAQAAAPDPTAPEQVQGRRDSMQRLTVPVTIGGGGPYQFVVDTGSERTVISRELAERLTLTPSRPVTVVSIAGENQVATATVPSLKLTAGRGRMSEFDAPILSGVHLGAEGMLGLDSLRSKRVVLDFKAMRMSISEAGETAGDDSDEIVVTAKRRLGQLVLVDAEADGQRISVVIDTGSAVSIGNDALRAKLARNGRLGLVVPISITSVTGEQTPADYSSIRKIRIGGVNLDNMPIAFADAGIFHHLGLDKRPALLLGMDALLLFDRVSIDFANRNVRFLLPGEALVAPPRMASLSPGRG
jgi:predicted aspartyl protease